MDTPLYFTICSKNYAAYALTLGRSLARAAPDSRFVIFLADKPLTDKERSLVEFDTVEAESLDLPDFADMALRYSVIELNTAIKPACFEYAFDVLGARSAIYLDPDILVLRPLAHVESALAGGAELVLTPHSLRPLDDGEDPDDLRLLRTGTYNLGFAAFANAPDARRLLAWWKDRLAADCRIALDEGIFVDQKWMDLGPSYVGATHILRLPGYNAAYWNLLHRPIEKTANGWLAAGEPLHFFHFSGVDPMDDAVFSKHQSRFQVDTIGDLAELLRAYLSMLRENGHAVWRAIPYGFNQTPDGVALTDAMRAVWRRAHPRPAVATREAAAELESLCNAPSPLVGEGGGRITNLTYEIWAGRPDLRRIFDLSSRQGRADFNAWLLTSGLQERQVEPRHLAHLGAATGSGAPGAAMTAPVHIRGPRSAALALALGARPLLRPLLGLVPPSLAGRVRRRLNRLIDGAGPGVIHEPGADPERREGAVAVYGYFATESGVGEGARRAFRALRSVGCPVSARRASTRGVFQDKAAFEAPYHGGPSQADTHLFHINADQMVGAHSRFDENAFAPDRLRIGYWAWELDRFPDAWRPAFDMVDEIWTPSRFVRDTVQAATDKPVHIIPHPAPTPPLRGEGAQAAARRRFGLPQTGVLFLSMLDFNSFAERKNPEGALAAFDRARAADGEIGLVIKAHGGARHDRRRLDLLARIRRRPSVHVIDRVLNDEEIEDLYAACDGLVSLHRSEGFGLPLAEAMARGLPVIATDYSGSTDFVDAEVGAPIPFRLVPVPAGAYPHHEGARWAEPDIEAAGAAIARLAANPDLRARLGATARRRVAETLSYEAVGRRMLERIEALRRARADASPGKAA